MVSAIPESPSPGFIAVLRFRPDDEVSFMSALREAVAVLATFPGFVDARISRALDERILLLVLGWETVGAYRRALSAYDVKVAVVPLLSRAVDESTAYEVLHQRDGDGVVDAVSTLAADADSVSLGEAAAGFVPPAGS
jgi:hypothetical protein